MVNYLLQAYITDDVVPEKGAKFLRFTQPLNRSTIEYTELIWVKVIRCT